MNLPWAPKAKPFEKMEVSDNFYQSMEWKRFRRVYIATHPLCVKCYQDGRTVSASVVDHITPINDGGERFDEANLQPLCARCHNTKSVNDRWRKRKVK